MIRLSWNMLNFAPESEIASLHIPTYWSSASVIFVITQYCKRLLSY